MANTRRPAVRTARVLSGAPLSLTHADFPDLSNLLVVGIGASAGGLEACAKLLDALPADSGMSFILVQHLDPHVESMMVDLLANHTAMSVRQAAEGMMIERNNLYVIPPATYLSVRDGTLHLSPPLARHGARLPFDFLLLSLAKAYGPRAICVVLSGTGADGTIGLAAVKESGGYVIVQDPDEAAYDGMPRNAIATKAVDFVLPVAKIPDHLVEYSQTGSRDRQSDDVYSSGDASVYLPKIIELLRTRTPHNFTLYKPGTLERRIERRMGMAAIEIGDMARYFDILEKNPTELNLLAKDLLINVTSFFRDPEIFDFLAKKIIPDIVRDHAPDRPIRIWIAGCSTGEETYSLAMLFREEISAAKLDIKLQVFASDVDQEAVVTAREGLYPKTIETYVSAERLSRFFSDEGENYRIKPDLRGAVVFTAQDVLTDPPFSRLDLVSCRNLLIYLRPEAQSKVVSVFHFSLHEGGILLLGNAETIGHADGRFEVISKKERVYRHIGRKRSGEFGFSMTAGDGVRVPVRQGQGPTPARQTTFAELCRRLVIDTYAPAAVLINRKHECLYSLGPTERYLRVAQGDPTHDLLAMVRQGLRTKLRSAIERAFQENGRVVVSGGRIPDERGAPTFNLEVQPVMSDGEQLLLICFVNDAKHEPSGTSRAPHNTELEQELEATKRELERAIRDLEISSQEQKVINEEALSVNEEFQSTNEELLTSKEELQSLNEELTALNSQLQETLERQRTTSNDLQNILYSTDVATLFLDTDLKIRFFTPATKLLFNVIPGDVGRPLADLRSLAPDSVLLTDARAVLQNLEPIDREIESQNGAWYNRRILPYRTQENGVEGVVITFVDITERRRVTDVVSAAKRQAELANISKSRFLAAASHDLRQPLQSIALIQGILARTVEGPKAQNLVARLDETLGAMSGMLNVLLDINQIEAGAVRPEISGFPINHLLSRLRDEFAYHAHAKGLSLQTVPCGLWVRSDPRLLEQMIRNLLSNALKYTKRGKVLLGCRRHGTTVSIEIWDTGIGIPKIELQAIFEEYHQIDNAARERSRGFGLGLSIVERVGELLGHRVHVQSQIGKGSVFKIDVAVNAADSGEKLTPGPPEHHATGDVAAPRNGTILVVEDDPEISELLELALIADGHRVTLATDGVIALELVSRGMVRPDLVLADYNLPNGITGLELAAKLREKLHRAVPIIVLTGDISADTLRNIAVQDYVQLNKPVKLTELAAAIRTLLPNASFNDPSQVLKLPAAVSDPRPPVIFVIDDDRQIRDRVRDVLEKHDQIVEDYESCEAFLDVYTPGREACLLVDAYLPGMSGLDLLRRLNTTGSRMSSIMITGDSDVQMVVEAMKAGASDFIEKPFGVTQLLTSIERAFEHARDSTKLVAWRETAAGRIAGLTLREREVMNLVLAGQASKNIAFTLGISQRTVENHRASIMRKTDADSLPALGRLAFAAQSLAL